MIKLLKKRNTLGRLLVGAAVLALFLSFVGNLTKNFAEQTDQEQSFGTSVKIVLDTIPAAIKVFRAKPRAEVGSEGWILTVAETIGAMVTFSAVLTLLWTVLKEQVEKLRISFLRRHTLVLGFGEQAKLFLKSKQRPEDKAVVVIDPKASDKIRDKVHAVGCLHYASTDETSVADQLRACRIKRAERLIIATRSDADTLEITKELAESDLPFPNDIVVDIHDVALHQQLSQDDAFMQHFGSSLRLFNYPKAAAVDLISRTNFASLARVQNQQRVCLLVFGATLEAAEAVMHFLRSAPSFLEQSPQIIWVVEERAVLVKMLSLNYAPLGELLVEQGRDGPLAWSIDLEVVEAAQTRAPYDPTVLIEALEVAKAEPTAIIVAEDEAALSKSNVQIATALREASRRLSELSVPIFVFSGKKGAEDQFFRCRDHDKGKVPTSQKKIPKTKDLAEVIEPFGRSDEVCAWGTLDTERERHAQQIHAQYLADRLQENDSEAQRAASLQPWERLSETYKNANRLAADQMKALGFAKDDLLETRGVIGAPEVEMLAALTHDAWRIDRALDGWRQGSERDNQRKYHPDLIPYEQLADQIKEYDRARVRDLLNNEPK